MRQDETSRVFVGERISEIIMEATTQVTEFEAERLSKKLMNVLQENNSLKTYLKAQDRDFSQQLQTELNLRQTSEGSNKQLSKENSTLKEECSNLATKIQNLKIKHEQTLTKKLKPLLELRESETAQCSRLQTQLSQCQQTIEETMQSLTQVTSEKSDLEETVRNLEDRLASLDGERSGLGDQLKEYRIKLHGLESALESETKTKQDTEGLLTSKEIDILEYERKIEEYLQEKMSSQRNNQGQLSSLHDEQMRGFEAKDSEICRQSSRIQELGTLFYPVKMFRAE